MIELIVVLVLLGLGASVAAVALRSPAAKARDWRSQIVAARREAMSTGKTVTGWSDSSGRFAARSDGLILTDSAPFTGAFIYGAAK